MESSGDENLVTPPTEDTVTPNTMSPIDFVAGLYHRYEDLLQRADNRVADWPLMWAYWPTLALTAVYLAAVTIGPKLMANRKPYELRWPLFLYNMFLVAVNLHICTELFFNSYKLNYSYSCQRVHYGDDPNETRIAKALWWFYISKLFEFFDTIFFVLRKKNKQISFLHVYHHATMFPIWWIGIKWVPGGQAFFGAMINSFIHVLMYSYYGLSALGPHMQKYLWWKQYLTNLQLIQFVVGMFHAAQSIVVACEFPLWMQWSTIIYGATILSLFLNFYFHVYIRPKREREIKQKQTVMNGHSTKTNGLETNGLEGSERTEGQKPVKPHNGKLTKAD